MHRVEVLRRRRRRSVGRDWRIVGLAAVRSPVTLVFPGVAVQHDDTAVAVAICDVDLVRTGIFDDLRRSPEVREVVASVMRSLLPDLKEELSGPGELEDLGVRLAVSAQPDVALRIHREPVIVFGPLITRAGPAPRANESPRKVEFENRRRNLAADADGRVEISGLEVVFDS